jgi:2-dehydro-3-deoxy-D-gluconate 5-dehydrogenase
MSHPAIEQLFDLSGKSAIVTGGARGIGQAIAFRLAEAGAHVTVADIDVAAANQTVERIRLENGSAQAILADARSAEDAGRVVQATVEAFGGLDILVNNAGVFPLVPVLRVPEELWDRVIDINLKGVFLCSKAAGAVMAEAGKGGRIINLASIDALRPNGMAAHYNASKGGVLMLTKAMALELAPYRILVNAVSPGGITTPGTEKARQDVTKSMGVRQEDMLEAWIQRVPLKRMGDPDDVARVVLFLASGAADFITGANIVVDGGYLLS